ncbi:hypothetical protein GKC56_03915 [Neisseriaceae bacterium PsAf]|nr:hypothetical protein [Neisseriaceae bacterium PsAf]
MNFSRWHNRLKYLWLFVILLLIGTVTFWYQNNKINIQNDIYSLLPEQIFPAEINQSSKEIMDKLGSKLFVMLESSSEKDLNASTQFLAQKVKGIDWIKEISFPDFKTGYQTIFQYRNNLLSTSDKNLLKEQDYESLIDASLLKLYSPGTILSDDLLKQDPFLFFSSFVFEQLEFQAVKSHIEMIDAYPTIHNDDQWHRLLMFEVNGNVMDVAFQEKILPVFESIKQDVATSYHSKIFATGFLLFSISGTQSAKSEISIISWGSILGLILLIIIGFKSIRPIFTELTAITSGFLLAFVLTHSLFGEIHLLTLVFGASLIGISIDFSFYYLFTQSGNRELTALELLAQLMPILLMSLITTLLAYLCLYFTGLVGLQQIAIFSIFGLIGAWVTNFFLLPQLPALDTGLVQKIFYFLPKIRAYCLQNKRVVNLFLGVVLFLSVGGIFYLQADDNVQSLQAKNSELVAQQEAIQKWFGEQNLNQYFIVTGQDENNIVLQEYLLLNELKKLQKQKMISQINAIGLWVLPQSIQLENNQLIQNIPDDALSNYAELSGLSYQQLRDWKKEVENLKILTLDDIKDILMLSDLN